MWSNSHWKLTRDWQKDCSTTEAVRSIHMEHGRKGKEVIRWGPMYQGTTPWNGKVTGMELCPEEQAVQPQIGALVLGSVRKTNTLAGWRACGLAGGLWEAWAPWWAAQLATEGCSSHCPFFTAWAQSRLFLNGEKVWLWDSEWSRPEAVTEQGGGHHCWCSHRW